MVLPVLLLCILSMITLLLYFFACTQGQVSMHKELIKAGNHGQSSFAIVNQSFETSKEMDGFVTMLMHKEVKGRIYQINAADIIRAGEMLGFDEE